MTRDSGLEISAAPGQDRNMRSFPGQSRARRSNDREHETREDATDRDGTADPGVGDAHRSARQNTWRRQCERKPIGTIARLRATPSTVCSLRPRIYCGCRISSARARP
jgi:hypothetical protein